MSTNIFTSILSLIGILQTASSLLCYNGTFTSKLFAEDPIRSRSLFTTDHKRIFRFRCSKIIHCKDPSMCFVRSWSSRSKYAWVIQRGCYTSSQDDPLPKSVITPTRAMTCRHERLSDAEFTVCLCQADWCNSAVSYDICLLLQRIITATSVILNTFICKFCFYTV